MLDDLTIFHQLDDTMNGPAHLFQPMPSYRMGGGNWSKSNRKGENHPGGVLTHFYLESKPEKEDTVTLSYYETSGELIKTFSTHAEKDGTEGKLEELKAGFNQFSWDMRYQKAASFEGMILWWASLNGPKALPGNYEVRLSHQGQTNTATFEILADPRSSSSAAQLKSQFDFLLSVRDKLSETNLAVKRIRESRAQINTFVEKVKDMDNMKSVTDTAAYILDKMKAIEEELYQTQNKSRQDPLNFPVRLNNKLGHLNSLSSYGDYEPTDQARAFMKEVSGRIDEQLDLLEMILKADIAMFNRLVKEQSVDAVIIKED
jgi:hypothetical protein